MKNNNINVPCWNGDYIVLDTKQSKTFYDLVIVLAVDINNLDDIVTWNYTEQAGFYFGNYFTDIEEAIKDFNLRAE